MKKRVLRLAFGFGYVILLTVLLLYQAGVFGTRREWTVAVFGTLFLGVALAVVFALYLRVNDQIAESEGDFDAAVPKACGSQCASAGKEDLCGNGKGFEDRGSQPAARSYEEIYARFLEVMESCALSERELEVAWLLYRGYTNRQIGEELYIAESTVKKHVSHIYRKMDVCSRKEFRAKVQAGILPGS